MIPIVLAADKNYFYPLMTAIVSILENKSEFTKVAFFLFINGDYSRDDKNKINALLARYGVEPATYFDVSEAYAEETTSTEHITVATYYRLKMPTVLPQLDKCLYLDVDTLVRHDLNDLYEKSLDDAYLMGVKAAGYQVSSDGKRRKAEVLGLPDIDNYVNAGVLIFNLARMRENDLAATFDRLIEEHFHDQDQDILNAACYGAIKILPPEYNAMTKYAFDSDSYETDPAVAKCWTKWEWEKARIDPLIVHFADRDKPWTNFSVPFAKEWWHYAQIAGVAESAFNKFFEAHASNETKMLNLTIELRDSKNRLSKTTQSLSELQLAWDNLERDRDKIEADCRIQLELKSKLEMQLKSSAQQQATLQAEVIGLKNQFDTQHKWLLESRNRYTVAEGRQRNLEKQLKQSQKRIEDLLSSNSYRLGRVLSAPYRWLKRMLKRLKK